MYVGNALLFRRPLVPSIINTFYSQFPISSLGSAMVVQRENMCTYIAFDVSKPALL